MKVRKDKNDTDLNNETVQSVQGEESLIKSAGSSGRKTGFNILESLTTLVLIGVVIFALALVSAVALPTVSALINPTITVDNTELETHSQEHNYVTGTVSISKGQTVVLREKSGKKVNSCVMDDKGINETFALEIPKVKEGKSIYYVEHIDKSGKQLDDTIIVSVSCTIHKDELALLTNGTNAKLNSIINTLCWPWDSDKKKMMYGSGSPKDAYVKAAQKYLGNEVGEIKRGKIIAFTDCSYFVATVVRMSGADPKFRALRFDYAKKHEDWIVVSQGKRVDASTLVAGDVIQYKKKGGGKHVLMYLGNKYYAQASRNSQFPRVLPQKGREMFNASNVDISSLQVIRNKKIASGQL